MDDATRQTLGLVEQLDACGLETVRKAIEARERPQRENPDALPRKRVCRMFSVPPGVKFLDSHGMNLLAQAFRTWLGLAPDTRVRRSRLRVWLAFLLLRYSGGRLGEILALDDRRDFDPKRGVVRLGTNGNVREVALPAEVLEEMGIILQSPELTSLRGEILHMDQGFVRRKFYEQAQRSGLPKELLNPRVLRNSRAVELLRGGVPLLAVQAMLGHCASTLSSTLFTVSDKDLRSIAQRYIARETSMKTSARNTFVGEVIRITPGEIMSLVELTADTGLRVTAVITNASLRNLEIVKGALMTAIVKAPWVTVSLGDAPESSALNSYRGVVNAINAGAVECEVVAELEDGHGLCALVTSVSAQELGLQTGQQAWFSFTALSVILTAA